MFDGYFIIVVQRTIGSLGDQGIGININCTIINNLRYADDAVLLTGTRGDLQTLINKIVAVSEEYELSLNIGKTKYMLITKTIQNNCRVYVKKKKKKKKKLLKGPENTNSCAQPLMKTMTVPKKYESESNGREVHL